MVVSARYLAIAMHLQEAEGEMSSNDIRNGISNAVSKAHSGTGRYAYYVDHTGDEDSGDVIYQCYGDGEDCMMRAPYSKGTDKSDTDYSVDTDRGSKVRLVSSYEDVPDEADHYAAMESERLYSKGGVPICERFVSKKERDAASSGSFAGKGKSFPVLKAADVSAAARSLGRAGSGNYSTSTIKANIIRIAKEKGWESELPKAWQDGGEKSKESRQPASFGSLKLTESAAFPVDITIREAMEPGSLIKLIAPGKGSSAYYGSEVLKRAAESKIFHAGLPMRIDHPTMAQESERPEGSVKDWGAVLKEDAYWLDSHVGKDGKDSGPGLYSTIKPFSDHATTIAEKGPYAGVSIRANGNALTEAGRTVMREGVPVLKEFTSAEGADMVTRAGAGGMFLQESARPTGEATMTETEVKRLLSEALAPHVARNLKADAHAYGARLLESISLPAAAKARILERASAAAPTKDGVLDEEAFRGVLLAEAKAEGKYIAEINPDLAGRVRGMGLSEAAMDDEEEAPPKKKKKAKESATRAFEAEVEIYESMGLPHDAAVQAAKGRAA